MDLRAIWLPLVHRFGPLPGPGGLASVLSLFLHADATKMVHVTRYADVREVWERDDDFSVRVYDQRMTETTGPFILGMNDLARYAPEAAVLRRVVRPDDLAHIQRIVREETERTLSRVRARGRVDVVRDLGDSVPIRLVMRYFGIPYADSERLLRLFQKASWYIFSFWFDPTMRDAGIAAGVELKQILGEIVAERRRSDARGDDDVLGRLLAIGGAFRDGDAGIVRSLGGLCSGTLNAPIGLFANVMDRLLELGRGERARLHELARAALGGDAEARARLTDHLDEAERFGVFPGVLHRFAERTTTLAAGTSRAKQIPKGTTVVVWPSLAAFDGDAFERPFEFRPGRPKQTYMGFGHGRHYCLGDRIGKVLVHEMAQALLALPNLRRAPGKAGTIQNLPVEQASFPYSFELAFDPQA